MREENEENDVNAADACDAEHIHPFMLRFSFSRPLLRIGSRTMTAVSVGSCVAAGYSFAVECTGLHRFFLLQVSGML